MHLPRGIHVRKPGKYTFGVMYTRGDDTKSPQRCKTIDEALAVQADPTAHNNDDGCDKGEEHDEERDGALWGEVSDAA